MNYNNEIIVAIEGIDGAGKTTLIKEIFKVLKDNAVIYRRTEKGIFINKLLNQKIIKKHHLLQVPIYLFLSHKNYIIFKKQRSKPIIIMDRCFLSNICYFFPKALSNEKLLNFLLEFDIKLIPQIIFILDVNPAIGQARDDNKKAIEWLQTTRNAYLNTNKSLIGKWTDVVIIEENLSIKNKANFIVKYIKEKTKYGNR